MTKAVKRLFEQFQPSNYQISLAPDRENLKFTGQVIISGRKIGRPSQRLTFHQKDLKISSAKIIKDDKKGPQSIPVKRINYHKNQDEVRLHSEEMIYPGSYKIVLDFAGQITQPMSGLYPCFFKHRGKDEIILATQFESHHAREVFPCIDEPEAKATFDLEVEMPEGDVVLSNTPLKSQKTKSKKIVSRFETTPVMSTYLLAFVAGKIHCVEAKSKRGIEVKTWASIAQPKTHLSYANKEAIDVLDFFEDYFGVPFPLKKLDQVALPDFDSLAMENWGLVTFREVGLLADPKNRSVSAERLITQVVAHELSHQWFGNLVTMKWWDDLWLNESFATIMESLAPDKLHPEWQEWEDFTSSRVLGCANRDVYKDVQPVGVAVNHPDEILTLFDPMIVYAKGARILKMLFDHIGESAFQEGLKSYFTKYAYKNTSRKDLWDELSAASRTDVAGLMTPWLEQSGTPQLEVRQNKSRVNITQSRFLLDGDDSKTKWPIPLLADQTITPNLLEGSSATVEAQTNKPVIFNPTGSGHYIVSYEDKNAFKNLADKIISRNLEPSGRIIALNDLLLLSQKGEQALLDVLQIAHQCNTEDRDGVWSVLMRIIGSAQQLTEGNDEAEKNLKRLKGYMSRHWYDKLGWEHQNSEDPNTKQLRNTAVALMIASDDKDAIKTAINKFKKAGSVEVVSAEQRAIIAGAAVRFGESKYIKQLMDEYVASQNPDVQSAITAALCSTRDKKVGAQIAQWGMYDDKIIRAQDIDHWFAYLMRNYHTRDVAWEWLIDRWPYLIRQFGGGKKMEYFIWYSSHAISDKKWQKRFEEFFKPKLGEVSLKRNLLIAFAEIEARLKWRAREEKQIKNWLKSL